MTKEELAEKWVKENCCEWCMNADDCAAGTVKCHAIEAFIAGLSMKINITTISDAPQGDWVARDKEPL